MKNAASLSITIPTGYSICRKFITSTAGITVMSGSANCPQYSGAGDIVTTATPGRLKISAEGMTFGDVMITEPTFTQGNIEITFNGPYSLVNRGCVGQFSTVPGFFVNPSSPGVYSWAPSYASTKSGPAVMMSARPGFSQNVTIT